MLFFVGFGNATVVTDGLRDVMRLNTNPGNSGTFLPSFGDRMGQCGSCLDELRHVHGQGRSVKTRRLCWFISIRDSQHYSRFFTTSRPGAYPSSQRL